jgi:hypothetical protein
MKWAAKLGASVLIATCCVAQAPPPKDGFVPDEKTAIRIAQAALEPLIGKNGLKTQEPFHAELHDGVWEILGRWPPKPEVKGGGGVDMRIRKQTGEILGYYFNR